MCECVGGVGGVEWMNAMCVLVDDVFLSGLQSQKSENYCLRYSKKKVLI